MAEGAGAEYLASIYGTEKDRVNCPFYYKIGACRHGEKCARKHHRPAFSETVLIKHMFNNPMCVVVSSGGDVARMNPDELQDCLDDFYEVHFILSSTLLYLLLFSHNFVSYFHIS